MESRRRAKFLRETCRKGASSGVVLLRKRLTCSYKGDAMRYAILIYESETDFTSRTDQDRRERYWAAWRAYTEALNAAGVTRTGAALQSAVTGTTVRMNGNVRQVQDGPYADTKE